LGTTADIAKIVINEMKVAFKSLFPSAQAISVKYATREVDKTLRNKEIIGKKLCKGTELGRWINSSDLYFIKL